MRRWAELGCLAALLACACKPVSGIEGDDDGSDAALPAADASAGGPDAAADAGPTVGAVKVRVFADVSVPVPGLDVLFHAPDGSFVYRGATNSAGEVEHDMPAGSFVTVGFSNAKGTLLEYYVTTVAGVMPGDTIEIGPAERGYSGAYLGDLLFADPGGDITNLVDVRVGCQSETLSASDPSLSLYADRCTGGADSWDVLALQRNGMGGYAQHTLVADAKVDGTAYALADWTADWSTLDVELSNPPPRAVLAAVELGLYRNDLDYAYGTAFAGLTGSDSGRASVDYPTGFPQSLQPRLQVFFSDTASSKVEGVQFVLRNMPATGTGWSVDLSGDLLPEVQDVAFDPAAPADDWTLRWSVPGGFPSNMGLAMLHWRDEMVVVTRDWRWVLVMPPTMTSPYALPDLPDDIVRHPTAMTPAWPPPADMLVDFLVGFVHAPHLGTWNELRQDRASGRLENLLPHDLGAGTQVRLTAGGLFTDSTTE